MASNEEVLHSFSEVQNTQVGEGVIENLCKRSFVGRILCKICQLKLLAFGRLTKEE